MIKIFFAYNKSLSKPGIPKLTDETLIGNIMQTKTALMMQAIEFVLMKGHKMKADAAKFLNLGK